MNGHFGRKPLNKGQKLKPHFIGRPSPDPQRTGVIVPIRIAIPENSLRKSWMPDRDIQPDMWLDVPEEGGIVELSFMRWRVGDTEEEWPYFSQGYQLQAAFPFEDDETVGVFTHYLAAGHPVTKIVTGQVSNFFTDVRRYGPLASPGRVGTFVTESQPDKSILVIEFYVDLD